MRQGCRMPRWALPVVLALWVPGPSAAQTLSPCLRPDDVDLANCAALAEDQVRPLSPEALEWMMGFSQQPAHWSAGQAGETDATFHYLLALKRPTEIGSVVAVGVQRLYVLKADAPFPGDPRNPAHWSAVEPLPRQMPDARWFTLPPGTRSRALLLVDVRRQAHSSLRFLRCFQSRRYTLTPWAMGYAQREYTPHLSPNTFAAAHVVQGSGIWRSAGPDGQGRIPTPPINEVHPTWFLLAWPEAQTVGGLWLDTNIRRFTLEAYIGPDDINPRAATRREWRPIKEVRITKDFGLLAEFPPVATRGLRLVIVETEPAKVAEIRAIHALGDLGQKPLPALPTPQQPSRPPVTIAYEAPQEGIVTLVVNDAQGRRVRNLVVRQPHEAGPQQAGWDLKDEFGQFVPPGQYRWKAAVMPPLQVKYHLTPYPNVPMHAPGNSPWLNGHHGPGGWMADHSPPIAACAIGQRVYLGSYVQESGVGLIECDLDGRKRWGHHSFASWTGVQFLAADDKALYNAATVLNTPNEKVWAVDHQSKEVRELISVVPSAARQRGLRGLAVHDGTLFLAVRSAENWFANAMATEDVDLDRCLPRYRPQRKPRFAYENVPDPQTDFLKLFRLKDPPPGDVGLTWLTTHRGRNPRQQHVVLAFRRSVPLGSIALPVPQEKNLQVRLSVLKPDAPFPPDADDPRHWVNFPHQPRDPWEVLPAPPGTVTRALRVTVINTDIPEVPDDLLAVRPKPADEPPLVELDDLDAAPRDELLEFGGNSAEEWRGQLEGMKLLRRRYTSRLPQPRIHVNSGQLQADGTWDAMRQRPLSESDPGIYALEWDQPQSLRGLAIKEIDGQFTKIDVYTGPAGEIDIAGSDGWQEVATYEQGRRDVGNGYGLGVMNPRARYVDGYVDFGQEVRTRAVRLRIVAQWADNGQAGCMGVRQDRGAGTLDPTRCRVYGVAAVQYLGEEPPLDSLQNSRIERYNTTDGKLLGETAVAHVGQIAIGPAGTLYAISAGQVAQVDIDRGTTRPLTSDLQQPTALAVDRRGRLYVFDAADQRRQVRVYEADGKHSHSIGLAGGFQTGPWEPRRLGQVVSLAVDQRDQLWVVENQYFPKRITVWSTDGEFLRELLGNTEYGGGGVLDPGDKTRLFYGPLEFELDWNTGATRLKNLTWQGETPAPEVPIRVGGRLYLVTRPKFAEMGCGMVYRYEQGRVSLAAAVGPAVNFAPLKSPQLQRHLGNRTLKELKFTWSDRNGDGQVQGEEVVFSTLPPDYWGLTNFNQDLSIQASRVRYRVREFLPNGAPVYEEETFPALQGRYLYRLSDGDFYRLGTASLREAVVSPQGEARWTYAQEGEPGVQALHHARPFARDQVVAQFGIVGHVADDPNLGEFVVIHGNSGAWNVWTADGLLLGPLFRDLRDPAARSWSMRQFQRGGLLPDITAGQEHFAGYFCRADDGKYYCVAGHNHASVLEVVGLEQARRFEGSFEVAPAQVAEAQRWQRRQQQEEIFRRAPVADAYRMTTAPEIDGALEDWPFTSAEMSLGTQLRLGYDEAHLYVAVSVRGLGPLRNSAQQWDRLFQGGAAVDLHLGLDPQADPKRQAPVAGDMRLLMSRVGREYRAVLYRAVVPGTPPQRRWEVVSPTGRVEFDEVRLLPGVRMAHRDVDNGYDFEAAVPLRTLGMKAADGVRLKFDWGLLSTDEEGHQVLRRVYWANQATNIVADAPSEARLHPNLWGHLRLSGKPGGVEQQLEGFRVVDEPAAGAGVKKDIDDILNELDRKQPKK